MHNKDVKQPLKKSKGWLGWLKEAFILTTIIIVIGWGVDIWRSQSMASGQIPTLITESVQGQNIDLIAMSQEKPVLVYFWATWCAICSSVSPSVDFIADHYQVVTVALTSGEPERIKQYMNAKQYEFDVVNDPKGEVSREWGISVTPTLVVVNKGKITSVTTGFTSPIGIWLRLLMA